MSTKLGLLLITIAAVAEADTKVSMKYTTAGQPMEQTVYTKGARKRIEMAGGMVLIDQCDRKQMLTLNTPAKTYLVMPRSATSETKTPEVKGGPSKGFVNYVTTITDTGETRQVFGYTARHIKTVIEKQPGPESCDQEKETVETDGWYIDFEQPQACSVEASPATKLQPRTACGAEIRNQLKGSAKLGFPLQSTMRTTHGTETTEMMIEVTSLSGKETLDASLFEAPTGFNEASNPRDLVSPVIAKKQGLTRVGVIEVSNKTARKADLSQYQGEISQQLQKVQIETVPLQGKSLMEINSEAQRMQCDYVLESNLMDLKKSAVAKAGGLLSRASAMAGSMGGAPKETFEAKLDFRLTAVADGAEKLSSSVTAKNASDFNLKTAASLATTAASFTGMGMMMRMSSGGGFNPGMMNMMTRMGSMNMGGMPGMSGAMGFDPTMAAYASLAQRMPGAGAPSGPALPKFNSDETLAISNAAILEVKAVSAAITGVRPVSPR
jgi:hypothetical protein